MTNPIKSADNGIVSYYRVTGTRVYLSVAVQTYSCSIPELFFAFSLSSVICNTRPLRFIVSHISHKEIVLQGDKEFWTKDSNKSIRVHALVQCCGLSLGLFIPSSTCKHLYLSCRDCHSPPFFCLLKHKQIKNKFRSCTIQAFPTSSTSVCVHFVQWSQSQRYMCYCETKNALISRLLANI